MKNRVISAEAEKVLEALKACCRTHVAKSSFCMNYYVSKGDAVAVDIGPLTVSIAEVAGKSIENTRRLLNKLEASEMVISMRSPGCISRWWPLGMAKELNEGEVYEENHL